MRWGRNKTRLDHPMYGYCPACHMTDSVAVSSRAPRANEPIRVRFDCRCGWTAVAYVDLMTPPDHWQLDVLDRAEAQRLVPLYR